MLPRVLRLHPSTYQRLVRLSQEAERDGAYRVAKRLRAAVLNSQGHSSGELAHILQAPCSKVSEWLAGLIKPMVWKVGSRGSVREDQPQLTLPQRRQLGDILRQRFGGIRFGYGSLDLTHDCVGHRGRVWGAVSSRPCTQTAA